MKLNIFYNWLNINLFVFGNHCVLCRARTVNDSGCCDGCWHDLPFLARACRYCAVPLPANAAATVCSDCQRHPSFDNAVAAFTYQEPIRWLITGLKFRGRREYARLLAAGLASRIDQALEPVPDVLIPVPLHDAGYRRRGFNQAELLARLIARRTGLALDCRLISRTADTPAQSTLTAKQRRTNLRGAFSCRTEIAGRRIALVDDVVTTGATAAELARELRRAGAASVSVYCVARATV
ncbi:double zinc ribbon domain-containing protein [Salinisphaera orenii]|uniref:double zinc ribbon domain-containing protein n=1 Tax=Salinisphaera orenii TaxID=856731 RepID=UPI000DBE377D